MTYGPIEFVVLGFPGNKLSGEIIPTLEELVHKGIIRILDIVFVKKDAKGNFKSFEFSELSPAEAAMFDRLEGEIHSVISAEDIKAAAGALPNNSSAGLLLWENLWSTRFMEAVIKADGQLLMYGRVPHDFVVAALEAVSAEKA